MRCWYDFSIASANENPDETVLLKPPDEARIVVPWGPRAVAVGVALAAGIATLVALALTLAYSDRRTPAWAALSGGLVLQVGFVAIALRFSAVTTTRGAALILGPRRLGTLPRFGWGTLALAASLIVGWVYVTAATTLTESLTPTFPIDVPDGAGMWVALAVLVLVGPVAEEVFFRGFIFAGLLRRLGAPAALVVSSLAFAVAHLDIATAGPAFLSGCAFAWVYWRTGSLWPSVLAHTAQNALAFSIATSTL